MGQVNLYCVTENDCTDTGPCKIGLALNIKSRVSALQCGNWRPLAVVWSIPLETLDEARALESHLLGTLRPSLFSEGNEDRLKSEWVRCSPSEIKRRASHFLKGWRA